MSNELLKESLKIENPQKMIFTSTGWDILGKSAGNYNIMGKILKSSKKEAKRTLLIGGVHGNETEGLQFMYDFCKEHDNPQAYSPFSTDVFLIPSLNPDGLLNYTRQNINKVDLNRNLPTKDWTPQYKEEKYYPGKKAGSEPENQVLIQVIKDFQPNYIISFHSWKPMVNYNGPAKPYAEIIAKELNFIITDDIGYPTPGSLGTYTGWELNIPTITLEFERGIALDQVYTTSREAIIKSFDILTNEV